MSDKTEAEIKEACVYLENLLVAYVNKYCDPVPEWKPLSDDLIGMLTQIDNASTVTGVWKARAEKAEAQRDDWKAMHRHAQRTIADLNADMKGQRARAEKAEAALREIATLTGERAEYSITAIRIARAALKEQG
jgi:hypothetical protein